MPTWPTITDGVTRLSNALFGLIKTYIDDSLTGQGLPSGGATGDLLQKNSATNYDAGWTDSPTVDALTLDTAAAEATGVAKLYWDTQDVTAALGLNANITYHLGAQELVRVSNRTGTAIAAGKAVYILGAHGDRPEVALADASTEATAATTLGITAESIADNDTGYVCVSGLLRNLNTNHLTVGQLVWLSETAGELTTTRPTQPAHGVFLGLCVKQGPGTSGILYVSVVNGQELDELHDVLISGVAAGDLLKRNAGNTLWVNAAPAALTTTDDTNVTLTLGGNASTALVNAASLTAGWTGQLALARGGTGASTQQGALNAIAGAVTSGQYLRGDGTNVTLAAIQAGDVPTLNQNTTGSAATLTTTRTLWGQNFNGSANVTGALTSVTDITMTGTLYLPATGVLNFGSGDVTVTASTNTLTFAGAASGYIFNDGAVGIGVTPTGSLHVERASTNNIISAIGQTGYEGVLYLSGAGSGKDTSIVVGNGRNLNFKTTATATPTASGTTAMTLTGSNNLGIGTTSPNKAGFTKAVTLESNGQTGFEIVGSKTTDAALGNIVWINAASSYAYMGQVSVRRDGADNSGALTFSTWNAGTGAERMRITSSGNVGIGVTPTLGILHAKGVIAAEAPTAGADFAGYFRPSGAASAVDNSLVGLAGYGWDGSASQVGATINFRAAETWSATARGTYIQFRTVTAGSTTLSEKARIDASGNVGLGVTPSAWDSTRRVLQIGGSGALWTNTSGIGFLFLSNNSYYDGTNHKYLHTDEASYYTQTTGGDHSFATAPSGTAGNNITFTDRFRVLNGGNIAIGATARLYLDGVLGTGDTYIEEYAANEVRLTVGGSAHSAFNATGQFVYYNPPTTASAANAYIAQTDYIRRSTSSIRYKHDIATLDGSDALAAVMAMRPVTYRGKTDADQRRFIGFIAEEMQEIAPLLCTYDEGGEGGTPNYVTYDRVTAYLVAVVQQQQTEINALKARIH